ncbi:hypothetical protein EAGG_02911 [Escherichia coli H588]|nr:hypothetical protein EAGG_02911 [Escherichia coli H588]
MAGFLYYFVAHACFTGIKRQKDHITCSGKRLRSKKIA